MNMLRWGSRVLQQSSPAALIVGGAALAMTLPPVRRGLRATAVLATRGVLMVADKINYLGASLQESAEDLLAEAREPMLGAGEAMQDKWDEFRSQAKQRHRKLAVAAAGGYLAAKERVDTLRDNWDSIVEEARQSNDESIAPDNPAGPENAEESVIQDGLEADVVDIGKPARRTRSKKE